MFATGSKVQVHGTSAGSQAGIGDSSLEHSYQDKSRRCPRSSHRHDRPEGGALEDLLQTMFMVFNSSQTVGMTD